MRAAEVVIEEKQRNHVTMTIDLFFEQPFANRVNLRLSMRIVRLDCST
jgi:hypothetical protein